MRWLEATDVTVMTSLAGNLPAAFNMLVGQRHDLTEVHRVLGSARLLTLTGLGGLGKSRLALEAAARAGNAFPDGAWLVDLAPVREPSAVASAAAAAMGIAEQGTRPTLGRLAEHLAERRALIILDNCEHVVDASAEVASTLLAAGPGVHVLATSQQTLGIPGEHVFTVPPLKVPDDAVKRLRDRATAVWPGFHVTDANWDAVTRLCANLDGLPLAIELTAFRLRTLSVEQVVARLANRFALLTGGSRTAPPRQRTLRALVDWSYKLCSPAKRLLWNRLSVFADGFGLDAPEEDCADKDDAGGLPAHEVLDLLDRLVAQSVVLPTEHEGQGPPRYRCWRPSASTGGSASPSPARRSACCGRTATSTSPSPSGSPTTGTAPARRRPWPACAPSTPICWRHSVTTTTGRPPSRWPPHCASTGAPTDSSAKDGGSWSGRSPPRPNPPPARARALCAASWVALLQGEHEAADRWLAEAGDLGEQQDDPVVRAHVLNEGGRGPQ